MVSLNAWPYTPSTTAKDRINDMGRRYQILKQLV